MTHEAMGIGPFSRTQKIYPDDPGPIMRLQKSRDPCAVTPRAR